jgi:hypothetical protein
MCAMARSHLSRRATAPPHRNGPALRGLRVVIAAVAGAGVAGIAAAALGVPELAQAAAAAQPSTEVALTVRSMSPAYARAGRAITISGTIRNLTAAPIAGVAVQFLSSRTALTSQSALETYARTGYQQPTVPVRSVVHVSARIPAHATAPFSAQLPASSIAALGLSCFGVYPLTLEVTAAGSVLASHPIPLPFWPAKPHSCRTQARPRPALINWIWPLIDVPRLGPCPGILHDNGLAASLAADGRLGELLAVGARYTATAHLTWAVDPALLNNASTMTGPYRVGGRANCAGGRPYPASLTARAWLAGLRHAIARQTVFATPYADVDEAVLIRHASMDIGLALADGEQVAGTVLGLDPVPAPPAGSAAVPPSRLALRHQHRHPVPAGPHRLAAIAWPVAGKASSALLEYLGSLRTAPVAGKPGSVSRVTTVILAMPRLAPGPTPGAVASYLTGTGANLHILLADNGLDRLLGSAAAKSREPGQIFAVSQLFLAETAMIIAESPSAPHSIVVAPPRRWSPADLLAKDLLAGTVAAPWLRPASAGQLISTGSARTFSAPQAGPAGQNANRLLTKVSQLNRRIALLQTIQVNQDPALKRAVFAIESSAWRGNPAHAMTLLGRASQYIAAQFGGLSVSGSDVTLGGTVSNGVKVSVRNRLGYPVQVRLKISHSNSSVTAAQKSPGPFVVGPNTTRFVVLSVHAQQAGAATLTIRLITKDGVRLPGVAPATMRVQATDFGTVALVIGAVALGIFVLASALRAIRHGRGGAPPQEDAEAPEGPDPSAGQATRGAAPNDTTGTSSASAIPIPPRLPGEPDSVVLDQSDNGAVSHAELARAGQSAVVLARDGDLSGPPAGRLPSSPGGSQAPPEEN